MLTLSDMITPDKYSATSDSEGKYRFESVQPGQYTLKEKTAPSGYLKYTGSIVVAVQANQTVIDGTNIGHQRDLTVTPTATPDLDLRTYLPMLVR